MNYNEVYKIIATYANKMLPYYADGWERFPVYPNAANIINELDNQAKTWERIDINTANLIKSASTEIKTRAN